MKLTIETQLLTIIVQIFEGNRSFCSHALVITRLTGDAIRLTIPELCDALDRAARIQRTST
jgi:hypothetical protein